MKICPECGSELRDDVQFCTHCGAALEPKPLRQVPGDAPAGDLCVIAKNHSATTDAADIVVIPALLADRFERQVLRGRRIVISVIALAIGFSAYNIRFYVATLGTQRLFTQAVRFTLTAVLCYYLYWGHGWARWILAILSILAAVVGVFSALSVSSYTVGGRFFLACISILYAAAGIALFVSPSVSAFLKSQQRVRQSGQLP